MIFTLAWKERREHQGIWLTMIIMTVVMGLGLPQIVAMGDPSIAVQVAALAILGMAAAYGVVCGAMMFAGEHEGGTLVFLDIFLGRRSLLWMGKFLIGVILVVTQVAVVALALRLLKQDPPGWAMALVGQNADRPDRSVWILILPVVSLEAYAWGLLGSSLTRRVLAGAAVAALGVTPVWLLAIIAPPYVFFPLQAVIAVVVLAISYSTFLGQSREAALRSPPEPEGPLDTKGQFLQLWEEFERDDEMLGDEPAPGAPASVPASGSAWATDLELWEKFARDDEIPRAKPGPAAARSLPSASPAMATDGVDCAPMPRATESRPSKDTRARSPIEVLWWLTIRQFWPLLWPLAGAGLLIGFIIAANTQVLWPLATLILGVACGTAAFAPEQRDLSYQFLAAQHFPLKTIWRFKILFWLGVAVLVALVMVFGHYLSSLGGAFGPRDHVPVGFHGTLPELMGPILFFGVWLVYGFSTGQVFVWLCRKSILALLVSFLVAAAAIGLWLPSLLCGGMSGWQLWMPPLTMLVATWYLVRAWAAGRIKERKPLTALISFGLAATVWVSLNLGFRAWEIPDVGKPIDPVAFRAKLPIGNDDPAAKAIQQAVGQFGERKDQWLAEIAKAARLPAGVLEVPRADGQLPLLTHLPACRKMTDELLRQARAKEPGPAFEHLAQILALSRNLRNKAPLESYLAGIQAEEDALKGLRQWLARGKPAPHLLRRVLDELNRHADETPPPLSCLQTECFRSGGLLANPYGWTLKVPGAADTVPEQRLAGSIALSLEMPWEAERKTRLWQLVWAGLFRALHTPHWQLPAAAEEPQTEKEATRKILHGWLPATEGPGAALTRAHMVRLVDASWLSDERLFCSVARLREAATRARCRVDATRLAITLGLYRLDEGKPAQDLQDLVPKYVPAGLPTDPYSGQPFRYRIAPKKLGPPNENGAAPGQGIIWSTGPDRIDHGGRKHGGHLPDDDAQWSRGDFDLITLAPQWP